MPVLRYSERAGQVLCREVRQNHLEELRLSQVSRVLTYLHSTGTYGLENSVRGFFCVVNFFCIAGVFRVVGILRVGKFTGLMGVFGDVHTWSAEGVC